MSYQYPGRGRFFLFPFLAIAFVLIVSAVLMFLWNRVLVDVLPVKVISYPQSIGLFILSRLLFGNFKRGGSPPFRRNWGWKEKVRNMTDQEREDFRQQWRDRCRRRDM